VLLASISAAVGPFHESEPEEEPEAEPEAEPRVPKSVQFEKHSHMEFALGLPSHLPQLSSLSLLRSERH
jgi:hypothetical protein